MKEHKGKMQAHTQEMPQQEREDLFQTLEQVGISETDLERILGGAMAGVEPADILGFSKKEIENFYSLAYQHYIAGNFEDAHKLFQQLCQMKRMDVRFWMGLGGCRQSMGQLQAAIDAYSMASTAECFSSPLPFLHIAMCFVQMNDAEKAKTTLDALLYMGEKSNPTHAACHEKARHMLRLLQAGAHKENGHG